MADTSLIFNIVAKDKTGDGFDKVKAGAAAAGVAIGAVLMSAVGTAIEKSKLDNKVAAQLGATPAEAKRIGQLSGAVYAAGFGEDMASVSTAIKDAGQNGLVDFKNMSAETAQAVTQNLLTVSSVLEEDTARTSAAISQMLRTGLAKTSEEAMDLLVTATQKGVNKSQDLLDTMNEYGVQFRQLGLDGPEAMGLLSQAIQAGARDSDVAADALKEFALIGASGSKKAADAFKAVGVDAQWATEAIAAGGPEASKALGAVLDGLRNMEPGAKRTAAAVGLFGTKSEDMQRALFKMNLGTAAEEMGQIDGATQKAAASATQGAAGWSALGRQFQMALVDTLNMALPAVNAVFGFMQKNSAWVKPLAVGIAALAVAIGIVTAATWAWGVAIAVTPIGWIVIGIVALVAAIVLVYTKTRFFQTIWSATWGFMKRVGAWFAGPFAGFFTMLGRKIASFAMGAWNAVRAYFGFWRGLYTNIYRWAVGSVNKMISKFSSFVSWIKGIPGRIGGALRNMFAPLWGGFRGFINRIIGGWNSLSFGIPGFSFAGISVPGISVGTPNIPYLATGGDIRRDGLIYAHAGERITKKAEVTRTGPGTGSSRGGAAPVWRFEGSNAKVVRLLIELLREGIRDRGGDVVRVLTPR